jgi:hypothetical protein
VGALAQNDEKKAKQWLTCKQYSDEEHSADKPALAAGCEERENKKTNWRALCDHWINEPGSAAVGFKLVARKQN